MERRGHFPYLDTQASPEGLGPAADALPDTTGPAVSITALAKEFDVTVRTLRFYQSRGLLTPARRGKNWLFTDADRDQLALIMQGKRLGFSLSEIREIVEASRDKRAPGGLHLSRRKCLAQIALLERQRHSIEDALYELRRLYNSMLDPQDAAQPQGSSDVKRS